MSDVFLQGLSFEVRKVDKSNREEKTETDLGELLLVLLGDLRGLAADFTGTGERAVDFAC